MSIASPRNIEEYNAFGPWVATVAGPDDVPPLYESHPIDFGGSIVILKFPRPESRRDLLAGMDLYDYLVIVEPGALTVLERAAGSFATRRVPFDSIAVISSGADLLDGHLAMQFVDGDSYSIPYNGSSSDIVTKLVDTIRALVGAASGSFGDLEGSPVAMPLGLDDLGRADAGFVNAANDLARREKHLVVLSAEGRMLAAPSGGAFTRWLHRLNPMTLHGAVLAVTGGELIVLSRVRWMARGRQPAVSMSRMIVMLDRVDSVIAAPHVSYPDVIVLTVRSGGSRRELFLPKGSPIAKVLTARF